MNLFFFKFILLLQHQTMHIRTYRVHHNKDTCNDSGEVGYDILGNPYSPQILE